MPFQSETEHPVYHTASILLAAPREGGGGTMIFVLQMVAIFAIFYFLLIRPHKKEQAKHEEMIEGLRKGDDVVTSGGVIGTIIHADGDRLTIRTAEETRLVVQRGRVAQKVGAEEES